MIEITFQIAFLPGTFPISQLEKLIQKNGNLVF